jgi:hypothetical protein
MTLLELPVQIPLPAPWYPTTTKNERLSYDGSILDARAKCTDDDEKRLSYDDSNSDARTKCTDDDDGPSNKVVT